MKPRTGVMRVTGGEHRGRVLHTPNGRLTRPTSARARSALFDWLAPVLPDARVLDIFAGTGSLGIEALSRGAREATFVERDRSALLALRRNLATLRLDTRAHVVASEARRAMKNLIGHGATYHLVLVDPPYEDDWRELARKVHLDALLTREGVLVIECRVRGPETSTSAQELDALHRIAARRYGQTTFHVYQRIDLELKREPSEEEGDRGYE